MMSIKNNTTNLQEILEVVNNLPEAGSGEQATPEISVDTKGLITATAGEKSATKQLTTQAAKTVTPSTSSQTAVASGRYTTGAVTVEAIPSDYIVTDEIAAQDNLISQIQTALEGKATGGGSSGGNIETCTVTITCSSGYVTDWVYTTYEDGSYVPKHLTNYSGSVNVIINNVVCSTAVFIIIGGLSLVGVSCSGGIEQIAIGSRPHYRSFKAPTVAGSAGTIEIYNND